MVRLVGLLRGILFAGVLCIQAVAVHAVEWEGKVSSWKGHQRFDFHVDGRSAYVVVPENPAQGGQWVWRARFPNYHPEVDILLLDQGFHIAYMDTGGMLGSPRALQYWDAFYAFMTKEKGLAERVVLEAVSRGGLFAYRWAARNPDKVACMYADTPVCDFKSWPLGQGRGLGNKKVWQKLLNEYGFTEEQALAYRENPIDVLAPIAQAKIPLLHIVSLNDRVVPPEENTFVLAERYRGMGGSIEILEVEEGPRANGHHFDHPDPQQVADFISTHAQQHGTAKADTLHPSMPFELLKPNIIYIMLDEWGYFEWSAMGHPIIETPHIDRVASEGMRFTQFLAGANVCAPTRSVLMTGQHTGHTTVRGNSGSAAIRADDVTIATVLKKAGYATGGFGKWGLGDAGTTGVPENHGFDTFFGYYNQGHAHTYYPRYLIRNSQKVPLEGNNGDFLTGETYSHTLIYEDSLKFIRENKDRPFFAYLPWTPPHGYWAMPDDEPAWQKYKGQNWDAKNQKGEEDAEMYAAMVEMVDRQIGEIMALLKELEIDENTIVFVCGDNGGQPYFHNKKHPHGFLAPNLNPKTGERFRGGKGNFYEGGLRIPFIVRWPGRIEAGTVSDHLGYFPDIMPTLAEIAGAGPREDTDGISILPTLLGEKQAGREQEQHEYLYWEDNKSVAVRMKNWKAIRPGKGASFELYDLSKDLEELNHVADQHPEILEKMKMYAKEAHSPVRLGKVLDASLGFKGHDQD